MEVLFTKFKTVIINNKELPEKKYIDELETKIKKRKITDFTYNIEKNKTNKSRARIGRAR